MARSETLWRMHKWREVLTAVTLFSSFILYFQSKLTSLTPSGLSRYFYEKMTSINGCNVVIDFCKGKRRAGLVCMGTGLLFMRHKRQDRPTFSLISFLSSARSSPLTCIYSVVLSSLLCKTTISLVLIVQLLHWFHEHLGK